MQEFRVGGNLVMEKVTFQNVIFRCSQLSYCPAIGLIPTVNNTGVIEPD